MRHTRVARPIARVKRAVGANRTGPTRLTNPLWLFCMFSATVFYLAGSMGPASAAEGDGDPVAGGIDECMSSRLAKKLVTLLGKNLSNPIKDYGDVFFWGLVILALLTGAVGAKSSSKWWKGAALILVLVAVVVGIFNRALNAKESASGC